MRIASKDRNSPKIRSVGGIINWICFRTGNEISYIYIKCEILFKQIARNLRSKKEDLRNIYPFLSSFIPKIDLSKSDNAWNFIVHQACRTTCSPRQKFTCLETPVDISYTPKVHTSIVFNSVEALPLPSYVHYNMTRKWLVRPLL